MEEKKAQTDELIVSIGKEKAVVDEAVEAGREDEESASKLAEEVLAFQTECSKDLEAGAGFGGHRQTLIALPASCAQVQDHRDCMCVRACCRWGLTYVLVAGVW